MKTKLSISKISDTREALLFLAAAFAFVSCHTTITKYTDQELVGLWVEPIPGMDKMQGVALKDGGELHPKS